MPAVSTFLALLVVMPLCLQAQDATLPLESVKLEGTAVSQNVVLQLADLRIGASVNKGAIETACAKLQDTGIFQSIQYRYGPSPGPKRGYAVTLTLADQSALTASAIDVPGVQEAGLWTWLASLFPAFDHKVPGNDAAQQLIARKLEERLGSRLGGEHLTARLETDIR